MKKLLPLHAMAENCGLVSKSLRPKLGRRSYFTAEGKVALTFLKMYTDATYYESEMRYPTDPKLLWEVENLVRQELARVRATAMEGSFGTQKEHYDLRRVKARTKLTEILYIFFGIHTANVVQLANRIEQRVQLVVD